ncbi:MAG: UvrD-helicase domain-containing protein [Pseudomonadota bacterium]
MQTFDPLAVNLSCVNLIEASAGTGKTHSIATLFVRLLLEKDLRIDQILVVTFTRAATSELRDRLRARLSLVREALLGSELEDDPSLRDYLAQRLAVGQGPRDLRCVEEALRAFDTAAIHTIHGFCQRVLQENAFESGVRFDATLQEDDALLGALVHEHWAQRLYGSSPLLVRYLHEQGTEFGTLQALARLVSTHRDAQVRPEAATVDLDLEPVAAAWRQARDAAQAIWSAQREAIVAVLCQPGVLHAGSYKPERITAKWVPWLDQALRVDSPASLIDADDATVLQRCTPPVLLSRTNKKFKHSPPRHPFFDACQTLVERSRELLAGLEELRLGVLRELAARVRDELPGRKDAQGLLAFDDLVYQLRQALRRPDDSLAARIRERYRVALIDEFQDTDAVQYEVFDRVWAGHGGLFLIGDPKQAIYSFRGADVFAYLEAVQRADARSTLPTNHRSDQGLVQAVNNLFAVGARPFVFEQIPFAPVQARHGCRVRGPAERCAPFEFLLAAPESDKAIGKGRALRGLARTVAADIVALLDGAVQIADRAGDFAALRPGQVAVLSRTHRQAQAVQDALREAGLPSVLQSAASVFDTAEALDLERVLHALADPGDRRALRSALATRILGENSSSLLALADDVPAWTAQVTRVQALADVWRRRGVLACLRSVTEQVELMARWLSEVGGRAAPDQPPAPRRASATGRGGQAPGTGGAGAVAAPHASRPGRPQRGGR